MKLTSTNPPSHTGARPAWSTPPNTRLTASPRRRVPASVSPRGNAEIEMILLIPIFLVIFTLGTVIWKLGTARMSNALNAENDAYRMAVGSNEYSVSSDQPPSGPAMPNLPSRYVQATRTQTVIFDGNNRLVDLHPTDSAAFLDPAWDISAWPHSDDRNALATWFTAYVDESHPPEVVEALGLKPPGPP